jgi:tRNA C32,U32 (ribose-2'-O)-methylase TrmJ
LSREQRCHGHILSTIPVNPAFSSLNLAQSVLLYAYELSRLRSEPLSPPPFPPAERADHAELQGMFSHLRQTLSASGFLNPSNPDHLLEYLRRLFGRAGMSSREVRIIRGIMSLIDRLEGKPGRK